MGGLQFAVEITQGLENSSLPGTRLAMLNWPPISLAESNNVT